MADPNFAESVEHRELLNIAKGQLDAIDRSRHPTGKIIGLDNFAKLKVVTVFSAIAVEAALNDYLTMHYLFFDSRYLASFFAETKKGLLRSPWLTKLKILQRHWPEGIPETLVADLRRLFEIRNRIVHQTPDLKTFRDTPDRRAMVTNSRLTEEEMEHMLRHHEIATDFLSRFWTPGSRELEQWTDAGGEDGNAEDEQERA